jgi:septal ring factor EnvC (AmiA/AmiB activator)
VFASDRPRAGDPHAPAPVKDQFQLVDTTKLVQTARNAYRFEAQVPAGKTATPAVTEERDLTSAVLLTDSGDEQVRLFPQSPVVSAKVKEGLRKAQGLRWEWGRTQREVAEQQRQLQAITEDQTRLRANLREVPQSSPLHKRYLDKLGKQEDEAEKYRADIQKLQGQEHARRKALDEFLAAFSAE